MMWSMKLVAILIALALVAPVPAQAQVFSSETSVKAKKTKKSKRASPTVRAEVEGGKPVKKKKIRGDSKLTNNDVVVIIEGA